MSARTKSILIVIATLLVGAVVGALATGAIVNQRVEELQALRMEGGFLHFIERVIEPTDERQRAEIRAVLRQAAVKQMEIRRTMIEEHRELFSEMRADLNEILTPEQKERLKTWAERERRLSPEWRGRPGLMRRPRRGRLEGIPPDSMGRIPPFPGPPLSDSVSGSR